MKIVHHHRLVTVSREDGGNIDLEELGRIDRSVVLLQWVRAVFDEIFSLKLHLLWIFVL
jgi:hypothetical protein